MAKYKNIKHDLVTIYGSNNRVIRFSKGDEKEIPSDIDVTKHLEKGRLVLVDEKKPAAKPKESETNNNESNTAKQ